MLFYDRKDSMSTLSYPATTTDPTSSVKDQWVGCWNDDFKAVILIP